MFEETYTLEYVHAKDCFLYFSDKWLRKLNNSRFSALELCCRSHKYLFTWFSQPVRLNDCTVGMNATFAQGLDLREGDIVIIRAIENVPPLQTVYITPKTQADYDILELHRHHVERSLLNQVQVVFMKETLTVWVTKSTHLKLLVDQLESQKCVGRLQSFTELVIANSNVENSAYKTNGKILENNSQIDTNQKPEQNSTWDLFSNFIKQNVLNINLNSNSDSDEKHDVSPNFSLIFRVHPLLNSEVLPDCCKGTHDTLKHPYNVFMHGESLLKSSIDLNWSEKSSSILCHLTAVPYKKNKDKSSSVSENQVNENDEQNRVPVNSVCVRLHRSNDSCSTIVNQTSKFPVLFVSQTIRQFLKLSVGSKVKLTQCKPQLDHPLVELNIKLWEKNEEGSEDNDLIERFQKNLTQGDSHLLNNYAPFPVCYADGIIKYVQVILHPEELKCWPLTYAAMKVCPIYELPQTNDCLEPFNDPHFLEIRSSKEVLESNQSLKHFHHIFEKAVSSLKLDLGLTSQYSPYKYNVLITGKHGSGKTRIVNDLCDYFHKSPYFIHVVKLECKRLHNKTVENLSKVILESVAECVYFQPSILVLDDLDVIAGVVKDPTEMSAKASYYSRVADFLYNMAEELKSCYVSILATSLSHRSLNDQLISARGRHAFTCILLIPPLNKDDRLYILKEMLESMSIGNAQSIESDLTSVAIKTEGFVVKDLSSLVHKSVFYAMGKCEDADDKLCLLTMEDIEKALESTVPYDLINVNITRGSDYNWNSLGGLKTAKQILTEVLVWPSKFRHIFDTCPLRNERGVLLYGLPGTGKTLLAKAVAGECGFNFISVKGPELLSKYIGASEEAVRNMFQKAQNAKPCILFFDEIDSLAPRRGHDNTGVTDRVVNQMLTNLDGVENLEGVWVLASTSRPDLLDPALLRPGRIGTLVYCPLPDAVERLDILEKLSCKVQLADDIDLTTIANQTQNFTAPDLQALLYTALTLVDRSPDCPKNNENSNSYEKDTGKDTITQSKLLIALHETKPYLQDVDRKRLLNIYNMFDGQRTGTKQKVNISSQIVTLA